MTDLADLNRRVADIGAQIAREYDAERPYREAIAAHEQQSRRIVVREVSYASRTPKYRTARLGALTHRPARTVESQSLLTGRKSAERRPATVGLIRGSYVAREDRLDDFARYPSAKALRRIEAAEEALAAAKAELAAATRAAFTYGRPVPLSAVKANTRQRDAIRKETER